jgi:hypothetical protein
VPARPAVARDAKKGEPNMRAFDNCVRIGRLAPLLIALTPLVLPACYPGDPLSASDTDAVITVFDPEADFATHLTFAMPDTVVHFVGEDQKDDISRSYDDEILARVAENLEDLGFTRENDPAVADVYVFIGAAAFDEYGYYYYDYCYYYCYWYGGYPGWGWYPYYPGGATYSYTIGTILITMVDPGAGDPDEKEFPPIWAAVLNGIADTGTNEKRIVNGIDQAFEQSAYLGEGK